MARKKKTKSKTETVETVETVNVNVNVEEGNTVNIDEGNTVSLGDVFVDVDENTVVLSDLDLTRDLTLNLDNQTLTDQRADLTLDFGEFEADQETERFELDLSDLALDLIDASGDESDETYSVAIDLPELTPEPTPQQPVRPEPPKERSLAKPARAGFWNPNRLKDK